MLVLGGVLDNSSLAQDSVINLETGNEVQFIDAYWNANRDIAGLDIACQGFSFSDELGLYEQTLSLGEFQHAELALTSPFLGRVLEAPLIETADIGRLIINPNVWTVVDGVYTGPMSFINRLVEPIQINNRDAIRLWTSGSNTGYIECYDQGDRSFTPTGSASEVLPEPVSIETPTVIVKGSQNPPLDEVLINKETGTEVVLQSARWDLYNDFIGRSISCSRQVWDGTQYNFGGYAEDFIFFPIGTNSIDSGFVFQNSVFNNSGINNINRDWVVQQGEIQISQFTSQFGDVSALGTFFIMDQVEIIPADVDAPPEFFASKGFVRSWVSSDEFYSCGDKGMVVGIGSLLSSQSVVDTAARRDLLPIEDVMAVVEQTTVEEPEETEVDATADNDEASPVATDDIVATDTDSDSAATDATDDLSDDSTGNSNDTTTVENENNTNETEIVVSNTQDGSVSIGLESSDETTSQSGGGSIWLPILMFAVALRRPMRAIQKQH